jgi:phosphoribosylanthranilate isomerase
MSRVRVKICGITSLKDLLMAVETGADAVGFVVDVPQSPRNLSLGKVKELMEATPIFVQTVVVTVPEDFSHLEKICEDLNPDAIQIHGLNSSYTKIQERHPGTQLVGAIQAKPGFDVENVVGMADISDAVLLDSYSPDKYGGTGRTHDWELSRRVRETISPKPLILAGGLKPENVKQAADVVKPYAVDVSSGVESFPGIKDQNKVLQFIRNAQEVE